MKETVVSECWWALRFQYAADGVGGLAFEGGGGWERVLMSRRRWWNSRGHYGISANVGLHEPGGVREGRIVPVGIV